jgi:CheY-like chemotaxis protein
VIQFSCFQNRLGGRADPELFHDVFLTAHYQCLLAADGGEAIEKFRSSRPSLVVTDFNLPDMSANELLQEVRREDFDVAVIILCGCVFKQRGKVIGFMDVEAVRTASRELGAYAVFEKPVDVEELVLTAERALASRQTRSDRRQLLSPVGCQNDKRPYTLTHRSPPPTLNMPPWVKVEIRCFRFLVEDGRPSPGDRGGGVGHRIGTTNRKTALPARRHDSRLSSTTIVSMIASRSYIQRLSPPAITAPTIGASQNSQSCPR